jgi:hypothetical protein
MSNKENKPGNLWTKKIIANGICRRIKKVDWKENQRNKRNK